MTRRELLIEKAAAHGIPQHMRDGIVAYILTGRPVGDFLMAVLTNNLSGACNRADAQNLRALPEYVSFLQHCAPDGCWGSAAAVADWKARRGLYGVAAANPDVAKEEDSRRDEAPE